MTQRFFAVDVIHPLWGDDSLLFAVQDAETADALAARQVVIEADLDGTGLVAIINGAAREVTLEEIDDVGWGGALTGIDEDEQPIVARVSELVDTNTDETQNEAGLD